MSDFHRCLECGLITPSIRLGLCEECLRDARVEDNQADDEALFVLSIDPTPAPLDRYREVLGGLGLQIVDYAPLPKGRVPVCDSPEICPDWECDVRA